MLTGSDSIAKTTLQVSGLRRILPSTLNSCFTYEGRNSFKFSTTHLMKRVRTLDLLVLYLWLT